MPSIRFIGCVVCLSSACASVNRPSGVSQLPPSPNHVPPAVVPPSPLSDQDRVAIYTTVLRAAAGRLFGPGTGVRLLLDPRPAVDRLTPWTPDTLAYVSAELALPLDSALVRALSASGAIEGVCEPGATPGVCANGKRGIAAHLGVIVAPDSAHASVWVLLMAVTAAGDETWMPSRRRGALEVRLVRGQAGWQQAP